MIPQKAPPPSQQQQTMPAALPVVDLRSFATVEDLAAELMRVGRDPGFFYVVGHDLGDAAAAAVFARAEAFFNAPLPDKLAYANGSGDLVSLRPSMLLYPCPESLQHDQWEEYETCMCSPPTWFADLCHPTV